MEKTNFKVLEQRAASDGVFIDYTPVAGTPAYAAVMATVSDKSGKRIVRTGEAFTDKYPLKTAFEAAGTAVLCAYYGIAYEPNGAAETAPASGSGNSNAGNTGNAQNAVNTANAADVSQKGKTTQAGMQMPRTGNAANTEKPKPDGNSAAASGVSEGQKPSVNAENAGGTGNPGNAESTSNPTPIELAGDFTFEKLFALKGKKCSEVCTNQGRANRNVVKQVLNIWTSGKANPSITDELTQFNAFIELHKNDVASWLYEILHPGK